MPRAFIAKPNRPAVAYLVRLHADLGGKIQDNQKEARRLAEAMRCVETTIRLFDPAYDVRRISVRRRNRVNRWFKKGTMYWAVLDVLKASKGPLTVREISLRLLADRGETEPSLDRLREMTGGVRAKREWAERTARHLKAELKRADLTYEELAERLKKHGFKETKASIANKLARATVPAHFFLASLVAIGCEVVTLGDI
jgi:hypothetical protein